MSYIVVGLGNPGEEYASTRHNTGRIMLEAVAAKYDGVLEFDKKLNALTAKVKIGKDSTILVAPETFMNNSGKAVGPLVKSVKAAAKLIVIYDDFNLPLGRIRISWNRSSGGHNGLVSIIKHVKTEEFIRIRVGTSAANAKGIAKVPHGEEKIEKFILGKFKDEELKTLKKVSKEVVEAVEVIVTEGKDRGMNVFNTRG